MVSMCGALRRIKDDPFAVLKPEKIEAVCRQHGRFWREGPLNPVNTVALFVQQVAAGNVPCAEVRHFSDESFTPSAYCQARQRLPLEVLTELSKRVHAAAARRSDGNESFRWRGHLTWVIDGSTFSMP